MRARRASGGREGDLVQRASKLRGSVDSLLPKLSADCPRDRFDRLRGALEEVRDARDDKEALDRLRRRGEPLPRALAGLLRFYLEGELPAVLVARFPGGDISFAPLSSAAREAEIAVQYADDPKRLMLGYLEWARKGFHFFATDRTLFCTGTSPQPPDEFRAVQISRLPYRLQAKPGSGVYLCSHLFEADPVPFLSVTWADAGTEFHVCRRCTKSDRHLLGAVTARVTVPDPESAFGVEVDLNVDCRGGSDCPHHDLPDLPRGLRKKYVFGRLSDAELLDAYIGEVRPRLERHRAPLFVAQGVCYGANRSTFIQALSPTAEERKALELVLDDVGGLFEVDDAKASRALEKLWPDHAETIVSAIVPDAAEASALVREARASPGRVSELLARAARATHERELLGALPRFHSLAPEAAYVDAVARVSRAQGARAAEKLLLERLPREGKERGIAFGLLIALGSEKAHVWQFTDTERQFGAALAPLAAPVLTGPAHEYGGALGRLLGTAGVADWGAVESPG